MLMIVGKQETPRVCYNVSQYSAEHYGGVQYAGSPASPGSSAVDNGHDDDHSEGR